MLRYEFYKWFSRKKITFLAVFLLFLSVYVVWGMYYSSTLVLPDQFLSVISYSDNFQLVEEIILIFLVSAFFAKEKEIGTAPVLLVSKKGKKEFISTKIMLAWLLANFLFLLYVCVLLFGYCLAYQGDFGIQVSGEYALELAAYPGVKVQGNILFIRIIARGLSFGLLVLICLCVSKHMKKSFSAAVVLTIGHFVLGFIPADIPVLGYIVALSPIGLGGRASGYQVLFQAGNYSVTILHIGFLAYIIGIIVLYRNLKKGLLW